MIIDRHEREESRNNKFKMVLAITATALATVGYLGYAQPEMQANNQQLQQVTEKWISGVIRDRNEAVRPYSFKDLNGKTYEFSGVSVFDQIYTGEISPDEDNSRVQKISTRFQWFATETGRMVMVSSIDTGTQYVDFFDAKDAKAGWGGLTKRPMEELRERFFKSWMMSKMHQMGIVDILQGGMQIPDVVVNEISRTTIRL